MTPLHRLAGAAGLVIDWEDASGVARRVDDDALRAILSGLGLACASPGECRTSLEAVLADQTSVLVTVAAGEACAVPLGERHAELILETGERHPVTLGEGETGGVFVATWPLGYHRLETDGGGVGVAICPRRAVTPFDRLGRPSWGATAQVYAVRDGTARGFGDFGALRALAEAAAKAGADALAVSPLHALFLADPNRYSPYSPSSRDHLNPLYADVGAFDAQAAGEALIDWSRSAPAKRAALQRAYALFTGDPAFDRFVAEGGAPLHQHAVFEALHAHFHEQTGAAAWRDWPAAYHDPNGAAVATFAAQEADAVRFHLFCQWRADLDLASVQAAALGGGMGLGLINDLAVGLDPGGSHAWSRPDELLSGLTIGAPPDAFQAAGQAWGITSFSPAALRRTGYAPFLRTVRTALRHAGGLRIDHALGLNRLWVLPQGAAPLDGAYLANPFGDMLRLAALESHRSGAVLIGEDLGVVPDGLRDTLEAHGLLGMRVLPFERNADGAFTFPGDWDKRAAAMTTTHDLPPISGWWRGLDIDWRERLGATGDRAGEQADRVRDRADLWRAAVESGAAEGLTPTPNDPAPAVDAAVSMVAKSACELALVPVEDLLGVDEAVNLPGVVDVHPNWRRRMPEGAETLFARPDAARRVARLNAERPK